MLATLTSPLVIENRKSFYNQPIINRGVTDIIVLAILGVLHSHNPEFCLSVHSCDP